MNKVSSFLSHYVETLAVENPVPPQVDKIIQRSDLLDVISTLGGKSFNGGLYRVFTFDWISKAKDAVERAFPMHKNRVLPFGFDWLGRFFCMDLARNNDQGLPEILMVEFGAGETMQIPVDIYTFHNSEIIEFANDALSLPFYKQWKSISAKEIPFNKCIGYRVPLFLGGSDTVENLEESDLEVYVEICGQLRNKALKMKDGQTIKDIKFIK